MKTKVSAVVFSFFLISVAQSQPVTYKGSETLSITFQTTQEVINRLVPAPLMAYAGNIMIVSVAFHNIESAYIGKQNKFSDYKYHEMYITIPVVFNGKSGGFMPVLYLDKMDPIISGREIWGFPKYYAEIDYKKDSTTASAIVSRDGKNLVELNLELGKVTNQKVESDPLMFILKYIPSAEEDKIDVKKLISLYSSKFSYVKFQEAKGNLIINNIPDGSIGEIPVINILDASYSITDFVLDFGKVEYDYLKQ